MWPQVQRALKFQPQTVYVYDIYIYMHAMNLFFERTG